MNYRGPLIRHSKGWKKNMAHDEIPSVLNRKMLTTFTLVTFQDAKMFLQEWFFCLSLFHGRLPHTRWSRGLLDLKC